MQVLRNDIQALRGLAVLVVLLYHVQIGGVDAGYLGVDIFFVISGYLITTLVATGIQRGDFRLADFYLRRAKRLLPAAYLTILLTALLAPWFLNRQELHDFSLQVLGSVSFTANMVLWQQTGYFEGASDLKPLLHMWSLSLEEQYYMLLPAALLLLRRAWWKPAVLVALLISLGLCVLGAEYKPVATFYLLPTRAWELLIGSIAALLVTGHAHPDRLATAPLLRLLFYPALLTLLVLPFYPLQADHPGPAALVICLATLLVILRRHAGIEQLRLTRGFARIGDMSYSLYLVHWPIVALIKNAWVGLDGALPLSLRLTALLLAFAAAYPMYRFVEDPLRRAQLRWTAGALAKTVVISLLLVLIAPLSLFATRSTVDFQQIRKINFGLDAACDQSTPYTVKPECSSAPNPKILVWGDSYAMHLLPGLLALPELGGVAQATKTSCGPVLGIGPQRLINSRPGPVYDRNWALQCLEFNQAVIEAVRTSESIKTVVLSSPLLQYVDGARWTHLVRGETGIAAVSPTPTLAAKALLATVAELRAAGKEVVLVAPPPSADFNIGACLERRLSGRIALGGYEGCEVPLAIYRDKRAAVIELLDAVELAGLEVIRIDRFLCGEQSCKTQIDGTIIYRDSGHLSHEGSRLLARQMNWAQHIK
ncbi:acyltransferase family protein [Paucibacter sp. PLA-PC-4]|uniref:acyltransferase family protein n=1 Tax=Paucibacter sp. PLA-PC-4 TaxID=2993655 RepID=UPI00224B10E5|nr:acyltransferase family protein [Paucibacter sp. PLA-PC-4]MCX2865013.1 acyltransferase family protein [Paucibacter sp. PLA-PC-4]